LRRSKPTRPPNRPLGHSMKNGRHGSAAACARPASRQRRTSPPGVVRDPAESSRPGRAAVASRAAVRTAHAKGRGPFVLARVTHCPGLRGRSSTHAGPLGLVRCATPRRDDYDSRGLCGKGQLTRLS
jgi:hypothetical protein